MPAPSISPSTRARFLDIGWELLGRNRREEILDLVRLSLKDQYREAEEITEGLQEVSIEGT